jgi:hypothetical protein
MVMRGLSAYNTGKGIVSAKKLISAQKLKVVNEFKTWDKVEALVPTENKENENE